LLKAGIALVGVGHRCNDFLVDRAVALECHHEREIVVLGVHLVDDLVIEAFSDDDARLAQTPVEQLLLQSSRKHPEDVAGTEVNPNWILLRIVLHGTAVKGGEDIPLCFPFASFLQSCIGKFHL